MHRNRVPHLTAAVMILGLLIGLLTGNFDCGSRVTFLDVGQGDGIVVETGQGAICSTVAAPAGRTSGNMC